VVQTKKIKLTVLCGPTGVGKSAIAVQLAKLMNGEIVNADSGQVYRHFNIGTAKPTNEEQSQVPHHGLDLFNPDERGDVTQFCRYAGAAVKEIAHRGKRVLVVGGAGLYLRGLINGVAPLPPRDETLRTQLEESFQRKGGEALHQRLQSIDPEAAARIHPNDPTRLVRALEVYELTGQTISSLQADHQSRESRYETLKIGLNRERATLYTRIEERIDAMIEEGWVEEVKNILRDYGDRATALTNIGYREIVDFLDGKSDWESCVAQIKQNTRHYAKRQLTWFRADKDIKWFEPEQYEEIKERVLQFYEG
jgi:tRNA dimethylallyltransferase